MAEAFTSADVLAKSSLTDNDQVRHEFNVSGQGPGSINTVEIKKTFTIMGITPEDFMTKYSKPSKQKQNLESMRPSVYEGVDKPASGSGGGPK